MNFSVLMSVYRDESIGHFDESLVSIWDSQSVKPTEIVLVQDGPVPDDLTQIIEAWKCKLGETLRIISLPENRGLGAALQVGLDVCSHEIVARMDADDIALPDRFEKQLAFLSQQPDVDLLGSWVTEMSYSGDTLGVRKNPRVHEQILSSLWSCPIIHPSVMMRRSKVLDSGNYNPAYRRRQDYELWFRCAQNGLKFYNLPESLLLYRFGRHTHKKQPPKVAWEQGVVGFRGATGLGLPLNKRFACFVPFIRSLLPGPLQHLAYRVLRPFDPRRKT